MRGPCAIRPSRPFTLLSLRGSNIGSCVPFDDDANAAPTPAKPPSKNGIGDYTLRQTGSPGVAADQGQSIKPFGKGYQLYHNQVWLLRLFVGPAS